MDTLLDKCSALIVAYHNIILASLQESSTMFLQTMQSLMNLEVAFFRLL